MRPRSTFPFSGLLLTVLAALVAVLVGVSSLTSPARADDGEGGSSSASPNDAQDVAEQALDTVEGIIDGDVEPLVPTPDPTIDEPVPAQPRQASADLTLALRDLAARTEDLPKSKQDQARRILARPDGSVGGCDSLACWDRGASASRKCGSRVCVHWVHHGADRSTNAWAKEALRVVDGVALRYKRAGYRVPKNDHHEGFKVDVYLADLGNAGVYGYCGTDRAITSHAAYAAYCVLDNNYSRSEYGTATSATDLLKVTAAHEFFHAVQFAYDALEDLWFMEATATWVEDEVFDNINDNRFYLRYGPMGRPGQSMTTVNAASEYGAWSFFRFLTEKYPYSRAGLPVLVRKMWEAAAAGGPKSRGMYSIPAIRWALATRGTTISTQFSSYAARNRQAKRYYEEGAAYPVAKPRGSYLLTAGQRAVDLSFGLDDLASKTTRYYPGGAMGQTWKLRIAADVNARPAGGSVVVTVKPHGRKPTMSRMKLNAAGVGSQVRGFGKRVDWIEVTVVNASPRFVCTGEHDGPCEGYSMDDGSPQALNVLAYH